MKFMINLQLRPNSTLRWQGWIYLSECCDPGKQRWLNKSFPTPIALCFRHILFFFNWTPKLSWIKVVKVDIFVLFLILEDMLSVFFTIQHDVNCGFVIYDVYYVEVCSLYANFLENFFFIINGCWILSKDFSASIEMINGFYSLIC